MGYLEELWVYILVSAPYLLLGFFFAGIVNVFISEAFMKRHLGRKGFVPVFKAALFGVPLPLCSCAVIPTAVSLRKSGAGIPATSSFLISTPQSGIDSMMLTYGMMDIPMTLIRPAAAFLSAFLAGLMQSLFNKKEDENTIETPVCHSCCGHSDVGEVPSKDIPGFFYKLKIGMKYAFGKLNNDMSGWLTLGILLGAMISYLVPEDFFLRVGPWQSRLGILAIGIPLYVCASASTPIAASLILKGISPGTALLFLLVGPATNISNIAVLQKYIGKKGVLLNITAVTIVALGLSFLVDWLYLFLDLPSPVKLGHYLHHEAKENWLMIASGIILIFLLLKGIYKEFLSRKH